MYRFPVSPVLSRSRITPAPSRPWSTLGPGQVRGPLPPPRSGIDTRPRWCSPRTRGMTSSHLVQSHGPSQSSRYIIHCSVLYSLMHWSIEALKHWKSEGGMGHLSLLMRTKENYNESTLPFYNFQICNIWPKKCFKNYWKGKIDKSPSGIRTHDLQIRS